METLTSGGMVYPSPELVREDMEKGICYVCTEEEHIAGVFVFFKGEDPTYRIIREGSWHQEQPPMECCTEWRLTEV